MCKGRSPTASEEAVLAPGASGYYRRARMLHRCAQQIAETTRRPLSADCRSLARPARHWTLHRRCYRQHRVCRVRTRCSMAMVERVLQRLIGIDLSTAQTWSHAQTLLANSRPGDFNQAMMELGATVCVPRAPRCTVLPVRKWCITQQPSQSQGAQITMDRGRPRPAGQR